MGERGWGGGTLAVLAGDYGVELRLNTVAADIDDDLRPRGLSLSVIYDETTYIDSAIGLVNDNIFVGGLLTLGTLLLFLRNIRSTLIVAMSIPVSVMGTFLALAAFNRTLNVISLAGIAFADQKVIMCETYVFEFASEFCKVNAAEELEDWAQLQSMRGIHGDVVPR
jgi:Cu/Ag efflux pump CusA